MNLKKMGYVVSLDSRPAAPKTPQDSSTAPASEDDSPHKALIPRSQNPLVASRPNKITLETVPEAPLEQPLLSLSFSAPLDPEKAYELKRRAANIHKYQINQVLGAIAIGSDLLFVKETLLPHGSFRDWLRAEFGMSERTAQRYMKLAKAFLEKTDTVSVLPLKVLHQLAASTTPTRVRELVIEKLENGLRPSEEEITALIRDKNSHGLRLSGQQPVKSLLTCELTLRNSGKTMASLPFDVTGPEFSAFVELLTSGDLSHELSSALHQLRSVITCLDNR